MTRILKSRFLQFALDSKKGTWSLHGADRDSPFLEDVWMRVNYRAAPAALLRTGRRKFQFLEKWHKPQTHDPVEVESPHGTLRQLTVELGPDPNGLHYTLAFALPEAHPLFLWRLTLENRGRYPVEIERIEMLRAGFFPKRKLLPNPGTLSGRYRTAPSGYGVVRPHPEPGKLAFFSNGWGSWSHTGAYGPADRYRATRLGFLTLPLWYNAGTPRPKEPGHFASDMFGVLGDRSHRTGILAGFLSQKQHFGSLEATTDHVYPALSLWANGDRARLDPSAQITTDWAVIQFVNIDDPDPLAPYLDAVARENNVQGVNCGEVPETQHSAPRAPHVQTGWCSWYHFFQDITAENLRANLQAAAEMQNTVPLDLFQIDGGFEAQIGDWFEFASGFPEGVAPLVREIREAGFTPGLWLAPFILHSRSKLARRHRDWLLRKRGGLPVNAGFVWNNLNKALDLTHPEALDYACRVVHTAAHEWGYPYLKLDFLYAAALPGRYRDRTKTRAQVLRMSLEAIREAAGPEVILLGCGCPLGSAIGLVDAMRIGADVAPDWHPRFAGHAGTFRPEANMPAVRNAIQNTLTRAPLHRRWWLNDPDCLLLRPDTSLTLPEVQTLATVIALTDGPLLLSDDLSQLPPERLRIASQLIPLMGATPHVLDWFDAPAPRLLRLDLENVTGKWHLLAVFNWEDEEEDVTLSLEKFDLSPGDYFAREFWSGASDRISEGLLTLKGIPAHGVKLIALTPNSFPTGKEEPLYLGSDLHISQGLEVTGWSVSPTDGVRLQLERPGKSQGQIELVLPRPPERVILNQKEIDWQSIGDGRYLIQVTFDQIAELEIT